MTAHESGAGGQLDLFGSPTGPIPAPRSQARPVSRSESNDVELMHTVAANAARCGYLLVGNSERVYALVPEKGTDEVVRVPRYEEDAVHQLLRRRWLTTGSQHRVTCGAASLTGAAVLVPKDTRARIERWQRLQRPPSWPTPADNSRRARTTAVGSHRARVHRTQAHYDPAGRGMWWHTCGACDWTTPRHGPDARADFARYANQHTKESR